MTLEQQLHHALDAHRDARMTGDEERETYWGYDRATLSRWVDEAKRALGGDGEVHLLAETEIAGDEDSDDDATDHIGFRGSRGQ